jgi:hypothetical protein
LQHFENYTLHFGAICHQKNIGYSFESRRLRAIILPENLRLFAFSSQEKSETHIPIIPRFAQKSFNTYPV